MESLRPVRLAALRSVVTGDTSVKLLPNFDPQGALKFDPRPPGGLNWDFVPLGGGKLNKPPPGCVALVMGVDMGKAGESRSGE